MASALLKNPYFWGGGGALAVFGIAVYQHGMRYSMKTGFHTKDPDPTLRKVEKDVLIAKYMRDSARLDKCKAEVAVFNDCVKETKSMSWDRFMTWKTCRPQCLVMMDCMNRYFTSEEFYLENKAHYLRDKALFQASSVMKKHRAMVKDVVENNKEPDFEMNDDVKVYHDRVTEFFIRTGNINSYDEEMLLRHAAAMTSSQKKVPQYSKYGI